LSFNRAGLVVVALLAILSACGTETEQVEVEAIAKAEPRKMHVGESPTMFTAHERATLHRANVATWNRAVYDAHAGGIVAAQRLVEREARSRPRSATASRSATPGPSAGVWHDLAQCESGGNWSIDTGNGYYGGLQFKDSTWDAMGGEQYAPTADQATAEQQIEVATRLQARAGWGQWPACTRKMGLR